MEIGLKFLAARRHDGPCFLHLGFGLVFLSSVNVLG